MYLVTVPPPGKAQKDGEAGTEASLHGGAVHLPRCRRNAERRFHLNAPHPPPAEGGAYVEAPRTDENAERYSPRWESE